MAAHPFNDSSDSFCLNMSEHLKRVSKGRAYKCLCLAVDQTTQPSGGVANSFRFGLPQSENRAGRISDEAKPTHADYFRDVLHDLSA